MTELAGIVEVGVRVDLSALQRGLQDGRAELERFDHSVSSGQRALQSMERHSRELAQVVKALGGEFGKLSQTMVAEVDAAMRESATGQGKYAKALQDGAAAAKTYGNSVVSVANSLAFETAQLQRSAREQAIHNRLRQAGVDAASTEGRMLAAMAGRHYDLQQSMQGSASIQDQLLGLVTRSIAGYLAAGVAIKVMYDKVIAGVEAFKEFEDSQVKIQNALAATGYASGQSAASLERMARELGDIKAAREATTELLKFRNVSGETFERVLKLAKDVSAIGLGGLKESAAAVGRALKDIDFAEFEKAGMRFAESLKLQAKELSNTGRVAEAQKLILSELERQLGGAGARKDNTLSGAFSELADQMKISNERFGAWITKSTSLVTLVNLLANALKQLNEFKPAGGPEDQRGELDRSVRSRRVRSVLGLPETRSDDRPVGPAPFFPDIDKTFTDGLRELAIHQARHDAIVKTTKALEEEIRLEKLGALGKKIEIELRKAGVTAISAEGQDIIELTTKLHNLQNKQKETTDAFDRAVKSIDRHIAMLNAETLSIGRSAGDHEALRAEFALLEAAKQADLGVTDEMIAAYTRYRASMSAADAMVKAGIKLEDEQTEAFKRVTNAAREAGQAKATAAIREDINRQRQMVFFSDEQRQIAEKLKSIYPDITDALRSQEAAQIRITNMMKEMHDLGVSFATTLVKGLVEGQDAMTAMAGPVRNLASVLTCHRGKERHDEDC